MKKLIKSLLPNFKTYKSKAVCLCQVINGLTLEEQITIYKYLKRRLKTNDKKYI